MLLLGPVHREASQRLLLPESEAYQTPLGLTPVDRPTVERLAAREDCFTLDDIPHLEEHCLEVQLPFLQTLFPRASIVPVLMGRPAPKLVEALAAALRQELALSPERTLIAVSANLTCYRPREQGEREAQALLELIRAGRWQDILSEAGRKKRQLLWRRLHSCYTGPGTGARVPGRNPEAGQLPGRGRRRTQGRALRGDRLRKNGPWNNS